MTGCTFEGNSATLQGGALFTLATGVRIDHCNFTRQSAITSAVGVIKEASYDTIIQIVPTYDKTWSKGSAAAFMRLTVSHSTFVDNAAIDSAGVFTVDDSESVFVNSTFETNSAGRSRDASDERDWLGGALLLASCRGTGANILNSNFSGNFAQGSGGAVMGSACRLSVENSTFSRNTAVESGGAVYIVHRRSANSTYDTLPWLNLTRSNFTANRAQQADGGAVLARSVYTTVSGCDFAGNKALSGRGGGCTIDNNLRFIAAGNVFASNHALTGGALLVAKTDVVAISDLTLDANSASTLGGGASFVSCPCVEVVSATVTNNTAGAGVAGSGGGIHLQQTTALVAGSFAVCSLPSGCSARLSNVTARDNVAGDSGGALIINGFGDAVLIFNMMVVANTAASGLGGGIAIVPPRAGEQGLVVSVPYSNQVVVEGSELVENRARSGGALAVASSDVAVRAQMRATAMGNNSAVADGGAVYVAGSVNTTISQCTLYSNAAGASGGALKADGCVLVNITNTNFTKNAAKTLGGAASVDACNMLVAQGVQAVSNTAASAGGFAITNPSVTRQVTAALILNSTFNGHLANSTDSNNPNTMGYGGAMLISGRVAALVTDTRFVSNYAAVQGGAVFVDSSTCEGAGLLQHPVLEGVSCSTVITSGKGALGDLVSNNTAGANGGAFYVTTPGGLQIACDAQLPQLSPADLSNAATTPTTFEGLLNSVRAAAPDCLKAARMSTSMGAYLALAKETTGSAISTGYGEFVASTPVRLALDGASWTLVAAGNSTSDDASGANNSGNGQNSKDAAAAAASQPQGGGAGSSSSSSTPAQLSSTLNKAPEVSSYANVGPVRIATVSNSPMDLAFALYDGFDQMAIDGREGYRMGVVRIRHGKGSPASTVTSSVCTPELLGSVESNVYRGTTTVAAIRVRAPKGTYNLNVTVEDMEFDGDQVPPLEVDVEIPPCRIGEVPSSDEALCDRCPSLTFSLWQDDAPLNEGCRRDNTNNARCRPCPDRGVCPGGAVMFPEQGSWHSAANSTFFIQCPNPEACRDGEDDVQDLLQSCQQWWYSQSLSFDYQAFGESIAAQNSSRYPDALGADNGKYNLSAACALWGLPQGHPSAYMTRQCSGGYAGNLCGTCMAVDGVVYANDGAFGCSACLAKAATIALLVVFFVINVVIIFYTTLFTFMADYTQEDGSKMAVSDVFQVLISHFQYYNIITSYGISWPTWIAGLSAAFGMFTGNLEQQAFTPSCLLDSDAPSRQQAEAEQYAALFSPAVLLAAVLFLWCIRRLVWNATSLYGPATELDLRRLSQLPRPDPEDGAGGDAEKGDDDGKGGDGCDDGEGGDGEEGGDDAAPPPPPPGFCGGLKKLLCVPIATFMKKTYSMEGTEGKARWASLINIDRTMGVLNQFVIVTLVVASILYPAWAQATLSIFSCYFLDSGEGDWPEYQLATSGTGYWVRDMNQACYKGYHGRIWLPLGIAFFAIVCVGIPFLSAFVLWRNRAHLKTVHVAQTYGFLYRRYTHECYWWGAVAQVQMFLAVVVEVFGTVLPAYQQAVLLQIVLVAKLTIDTYFMPTKFPVLARLEFLSLSVLSVTISLGLFFVPPVGQKDPVTPAAEEGIAAIILLLNVGVCLFFLGIWWTNANEWLQSTIDAVHTGLQNFITELESAEGTTGAPVPFYRRVLAFGARAIMLFVGLARAIVSAIMPRRSATGTDAVGDAAGDPPSGGAGDVGDTQQHDDDMQDDDADGDSAGAGGDGCKDEDGDGDGSGDGDGEGATGGTGGDGTGDDQLETAGPEHDVGVEIFLKKRQRQPQQKQQEQQHTGTGADTGDAGEDDHGAKDITIDSAAGRGSSGSGRPPLQQATPLRRRSRPHGDSMQRDGRQNDAAAGRGAGGAAANDADDTEESLTAETVAIQLYDAPPLLQSSPPLQ